MASPIHLIKEIAPKKLGPYNNKINKSGINQKIIAIIKEAKVVNKNAFLKTLFLTRQIIFQNLS